MRRLSAALIAATLILVGCSQTKSPAVRAPLAEAPAPSQQTAAPPQQSAVPAPQTAAPERTPQTVDEWNDRALIMIRAKRWAEARDAAEHALALDSGNRAAMFNLGRAILGTGGGIEAVNAIGHARQLWQERNPDVEYYMAEAYESADMLLDAHDTYRDAIERWPEDKELRQAMAEFAARHDAELLYTNKADLDGDGRPEQILASKTRVQVITGTGKVLIDQAPQPASERSGTPQVIVYPLRGQSPLVHIEWKGACPSAAWNDFFWYNRATGQLGSPDGGGLCLNFLYKGDGRFEELARLGGDQLGVVKVRLVGGKFQVEGTETRTMGK